MSRLRGSSDEGGSSLARPATCCRSTRPSSTSLVSRGCGRRRARGSRALPRARLREALALWRGPPLADFAYEPFAQAEIARLEELRLRPSRTGSRPTSPWPARELVAELEALVSEHPLRERPRGQLMLALYRSGRQAEALEAYHAARRSLVDELGIEPGRQLRELHGRSSSRTRSSTSAHVPEPARETARRRVRRPRGRARRSSRRRSKMPSPGAGACSCSPASPASARAASPRSWSPRHGARRPGSGGPLLGGGRCPRLLALGAVASGLHR